MSGSNLFNLQAFPHTHHPSPTLEAQTGARMRQVFAVLDEDKAARNVRGPQTPRTELGRGLVLYASANSIRPTADTSLSTSPVPIRPSSGGTWTETWGLRICGFFLVQDVGPGVESRGLRALGRAWVGPVWGRSETWKIWGFQENILRV
ncbi:hypothetical protein DL766_000399 [Monosporascus sp. MC13-8B]|uniref:Uncharacterized protein n=1 Tax=Monosporascus cannonballus TaxID=155416 RepID=A0ABY0GYM3_9PEZI|nr:hypothetical protein DL762_007809 [Monosporascus cannonballus]RYO99028.1 hypothetical protein DL763_001833 [Monosporascus cannonballus]RYP39374.1 hypothetical protein DL766_000399 [Monosporascus sp. MC13-8B]